MNNSGVINLADKIEKQLPPAMLETIRTASKAAKKQKLRLYIVGGVVRDILLERSNLDLDLVVDGDAIKLAQEVVRTAGGKLTTHPHFVTAKVSIENGSIDMAMARAESYARSGALPSVRPGTIDDDLFRRDFTINAMAVELNPGNFGALLDPHKGRQDLEKKLVRILHQKSFIDDATRIWRAIRYEQRLDFTIEPDTLELLKRDTDRLDTISSDRIRHELDLVLKEELPEKVLSRAGELGVLEKLHPVLRGDIRLADTFRLAREQSLPGKPSPDLYLALLAYRLSSNDVGQLLSSLKLPKRQAELLRDVLAIKEKGEELSADGLALGHIDALLHGHGTTALMAVSIATESDTTAKNIELYAKVLRYVRPTLSGGELKKMGFPEGPRIREVLQSIREAKLDGRIKNRRDEAAMAEQMKHQAGD